MAKLTATSYAILGLLERQPWSAYELTKYMQHSGIRAVWPRTESRIYVEFKNLVSHELATGEQEQKQGRKRTVYTITAEGRKKLRQWLKEPTGGIRLESEPLLKLLYSDLEKSTRNIQVNHIKEQLASEVALLRSEITGVLEQGFYFDDNALQNAELLALLVDSLEARSKWLSNLGERPATGRSAASTAEEAKKLYAKQAKRLEKLLQNPPG